MWASAASAGRSVCRTVGVTIGTSSSRCYPRLRTSLLASSIGNPADLFKPRLVSASSGAVCMGSPDPGWRVSPLLLAASAPVLVDSCAPPTRECVSATPCWQASSDNFDVWIPSFMSARSGDRRASPEPVCVQQLPHQCALITLHELVHPCPAFV